MEGVTRRVVPGSVFLLTFLSLLCLFPLQVSALTFYADAINGDDTHSCEQARSASFPKKTIGAALNCTVHGDTVKVKPGLYAESVAVNKSVNLIADPKALEVPPGADRAVISPPAGQGILVSDLPNVTVEGFVVKGTDGNQNAGISFADSDNGVIRGNVVYNVNNGIQVTDSTHVVIEKNIVQGNRGRGITYTRGTNGEIHNNLIYDNLEDGILVRTALDSFYSILNNTVDSNDKGISVEFHIEDGSSGGGGDIINNIVSNNTRTGIKIKFVIDFYEDFNFAFANGNDFDFDDSVINQQNGIRRAGDHSSAAIPPGFVNPAGSDGIRGGDNWEDDSFHLSQIPAGQPFTSLLVDVGALGRNGQPISVSGSTATDRVPDGFFGDPADVGFHYCELAVTLPLSLKKVITTIAVRQGETMANYTIHGHLLPDDIDPAMERVTVELDSFSQTLPVGSCSQKPNGLWLCKGQAPGVVTVRITPKGDFTIVARNVPIPDPGPSAPLLPNLRFRLFIGNDAGEMEIYYTGGTRTAS